MSTAAKTNLILEGELTPMKLPRTLKLMFSSFLVFLLAITTNASHAKQLIVGVNIVGVQTMDEKEQDQLIETLARNHVNTVRTGIGEKFNHFVINAYQHGIGTIAIINPTQGSQGTKRPADPSMGIKWAAMPLTAADPERFQTWFTRQLTALDAAGVKLTALELGNEINGPFFNGDFPPALASGRVLGISDLNNASDPEGRAIVASYRAYIRMAGVLKDVRDRSQINKSTPIVSAGLADGGLPGPKPNQRLDGVSIPATLQFLQQNGLDRLVDGYGVHVYPIKNPNATGEDRMNELTQDTFAMCTAAKPCWLTEWGFHEPDQSCPANDGMRAELIRAEREAFKRFSERGQLAATIFYSWGGDVEANAAGDKSSIFRCGALTAAGKVALSPL